MTVWSAVVVVCVGGTGTGALAQPVVSPRAIALAAYGASVNDIRGFLINPAGLTGMRDWDFNTATFLPTSTGGNGFVFHGFGLGKRFLEHHALGVQYAPGASLDFVIPSTLRISGVEIAVDKSVSYSEPFGAGYGIRLSDVIAAGMAVRMRMETVSDPQYQIQDTALVAVPNEFTTRTWGGDLGVLWTVSRSVTLSVVGRELLAVRDGMLPSEFHQYALPSSRSLEVGVAYRPARTLQLAAGVSTLKTGAAGMEWLPGRGITVRGGAYLNSEESPVLSAVSVGGGWAIEFLEFDLAYLHFLDQGKRKGSTQVSEFDASVLKNISFSRFSPDRLALSVKAVFGNIRESLVRIESVEMSGGIYPAAAIVMTYRPVGTIRVKNVSTKPVQARATFFVEKFMDVPTETPSTYITPGEVAEMPLTAMFNDRLKSVSGLTVREGNVTVSATVADEPDDRAQTRVLIHGRNAWDGDVQSLRYFVTPDDPAVIRYSRDILLQRKDSLVGVSRELEQYTKAMLLFNAFAGKLVNVSDPRQSADYVQYPSETLSLRSGDCDDMTVCFASLLGSIGIATAFVDVIPPANPGESHVYMMFDTGLEPRFGSSIAQNPKRYVIRTGKDGKPSIWIPMETTVIANGFEYAWSKGAQRYFDDVEIDLGLAKGWVRIVDVD